MSVKDYNKTVYEQNISIFNIKQLKKVVKKIEKDVKDVNYGEFEVHISVRYNDRDSEL